MANCSICQSSQITINPNGSAVCGRCSNCYLQSLPKCESECPKKSVEFIASCEEDTLASDYCTIVAEFEAKTADECFTPEKLILAAYKNVENVVSCPKVDDYLDMYNSSVRAINTDQDMELLRPLTALVTHCGNYTYLTPPNFKKALSLSSDFPGHTSECPIKKYHNVPVDQFYGSHVPNHYNIRGGKIILKDPTNCDCPMYVPPKILQFDYWAGLPEAKTVSDCLDINEEHKMAIEYMLSMKIALRKNNNPRAYQEYKMLYEEFKRNHVNYDMYIQDKPTFTRRTPKINWLGT